MTGDFHLFFDLKLDALVGNPTLKLFFRTCKTKYMEIKETYNSCDIWRIRITKSRRFTLMRETIIPFHST